MSVGFFEQKHIESIRTDEQFGICDDQNNTKAYTDINSESKWVATVFNKNNIKVAFTPIDKNIIIYKQGTKDEESMCDGMLKFKDKLYLVELKNTRKRGWIKEAVDQLISTIQLIKANHDLTKIKHKKVFACNKKHPLFQSIENEENLRFFRMYGFRLDIQAEIRI